MKIGIVTFHKAHNYGALLQAIALRRYLERGGHEVCYINYWPQYMASADKVFSFFFMKKLGLRWKIKYLLNCLCFYKRRKFLYALFDDFINKEIEPYCKSITETYDIVFYGSDQIWWNTFLRPGYDPFYFGKNNVKTSKNVSYAASMGTIPQTIEEASLIAKYLDNFSSISVREKTLKEYLENICNRTVYYVLDPTFLLSKEEWNLWYKAPTNVNTPYILFYNLREDSFDEDEVNKFAERTELNIEYMSGTVTNRKKYPSSTTDGPYQFIEKIQGASFVLTSSFHGVAFSIIFQKPFFASFNENEGRAKSLLISLGLENRLLNPKTKIPQDSLIIDYQFAYKKLKELSANSKCFIDDCLKK